MAAPALSAAAGEVAQVAREWKRRPRRERADLRKLLADVPPPTAERAMKELGGFVKRVFGGFGKGKKGKGEGRT